MCSVSTSSLMTEPELKGSVPEFQISIVKIKTKIYQVVTIVQSFFLVYCLRTIYHNPVEKI